MRFVHSSSRAGVPDPSRDSPALFNVGAVIVHYHREKELARLIHNLVVDQGVDLGHIVVIDNGSDRGLLAEHLQEWTAVRVLAQDNIGYGAAVNVGIAALPLDVEYAVIATHEVVFSPRCLVGLRQVLESDTSVGVVSPMLMSDQGVWSVGGGTSAFRKVPYNQGKGSEAFQYGGLREADWVDGAAFMMRRADLSGIRVAEEFFIYYEDVELGWRVRRAGYRVVCATWLVARQEPGGHLNQYLVTRNLLWLLAKQRFWLAWIMFLVESVARMLIGPIGKPTGAADRVRQRFRGVRDGLRGPRLPEEK